MDDKEEKDKEKEDGNDEEGRDDEHEVDDVDYNGASNTSDVVGPLHGDRKGHFIKPAWAEVVPKPPNDMSIQHLNSKLYATSPHKGDYVLNFQKVLWYQALPPLEEYGTRAKWALLKSTPK